jgi:putative transposase
MTTTTLPDIERLEHQCRRVLSWRLSNTLTAGFCVEALSEALARFGSPSR